MSRFTRMLASGTVTTALAAGLTVGGLATAPAQAAAPVSATYSCTNPLLPVLPPFDVPATFAIPSLPAELPIGLPTGSMPVTGTLTLDNLVTSLFATLGGTLQAVTSSVLVPVGAGAVGAQLQSATTTVAAGTTTLVTSVSGVLPSFTPDQTGTQSIALPSTIDLTLVRGLLGPLGVTCALKSGNGATTTFATYSVSKSASTLNARTTKVKKGKKPKVSVTVTVATPGTTTLGSVAASENGQPIATQPLYGGSATFVLKGLKKGVHTLRFAYSGSNFASPSEQTVAVTFPKAKKAKKHSGKKHHR